MAATKIKYVDRRQIYFPRLKMYPQGLALPSGENIIEVTETEAELLLKRKNGDRPVFQLVSENKRQEKKIEEQPIEDPVIEDMEV